MNKKMMVLISTLFIALSFVLSAEKTVDQKIAHLEKKLPNTRGEEKVRTLNEIAKVYIYKSADLCIQYATRALKLAQELD